MNSKYDVPRKYADVISIFALCCGVFMFTNIAVLFVMFANISIFDIVMGKDVFPLNTVSLPLFITTIILSLCCVLQANKIHKRMSKTPPDEYIHWYNV